MKILHYHHNGVGVVLSNELNTRPNVVSKVFTTARHPFWFKADYMLPPNIPVLGPQNLSYWMLSHIMSGRYNVLHSHDGIPLPKRVLGKWEGKVVQHYHSPLVTDFYPEYTIPAFVSAPIMTTTIPNSIWMPLPVDMSKFTPTIRLYNPNNPIIGFSYNTQVDKKKLKFIPYDELMEFSKIHKQITLNYLHESIHYTKMPAYYRSIDIYVDQLDVDSYSWQATEAAACGAIIVTRAEHKPEDCPFTYATRETLHKVLESIISLPTKMLINMKLQSINYIAKYHELTKLVSKYLNCYSNLENINDFKNIDSISTHG